jgi:hypothetical protein
VSRLVFLLADLIGVLVGLVIFFGTILAMLLAVARLIYPPSAERRDKRLYSQCLGDGRKEYECRHLVYGDGK